MIRCFRCNKEISKVEDIGRIVRKARRNPSFFLVIVFNYLFDSFHLLSKEMIL